MIPELLIRMSRPPNFSSICLHHRLDLIGLGDVAVDDQRILQFIRDVRRIRLILAFRLGDDNSRRTARPARRTP